MAISVQSESRRQEDFPPEQVANKLEQFQSIQNRVFRQILSILPWLILGLLVVVGLIVLRYYDPMFISGVVTAALSLFAFQVLMQRIPETLLIVWRRSLLAPLVSSRIEEDSREKEGPDLETQYLGYIHEVESWLNHRGQWILALSFIPLVGTWTFIQPTVYERIQSNAWRLLYPQVPHNGSPPTFVVVLAIGVIIMEIFTGFIIGLMTWRMVVIGVEFWRLGKNFQLVPQLGHPDQSGGFAPLGNLCLWNALIILLPGIFLGAWVILIPLFETSGYILYLSLFYYLLLIPVAASLFGFFYPLFGVHQAMVAQRDVVQRQLDHLSREIDQLSRKMLEQADQLDPNEGEAMSHKLDLMRQVFEQNRRFPVWPFNPNILIKYISAQAVPILSLTGLSQPITKILDILIKAFTPGST
jgi:hypothetical protein